MGLVIVVRFLLLNQISWEHTLFNLSASDPPFPAPESVSVAPIFIVGDSKEEGVVSSNVEMGPGNLRNVPGTLYELGKNYAPTTPATIPDCTHPDNCIHPGYCQTNTGASCTAGSCIYAPDAAKEGQPCDDGNSGTSPDTCTSGVCFGPTLPTGCTGNPDCNSPAACQDSPGSCNVGTGVCTYSPTALVCPTADTVACGVAITSTNGCGTCAGVGTMGCLAACTDIDTDNWCEEVSGTCDPSGGLCAGGYEDCNNGDGTQFKLYTSGPYYADSDLDTWGSNAGSFASVCRGATLPSNIITTRQGDCNDAVGTINPGVAEICGDGIDNDCLGGDQACSTAPPTDFTHHWDFETFSASSGTVIFYDQKGSNDGYVYNYGTDTFFRFQTCFKGSSCISFGSVHNSGSFAIENSVAINTAGTTYSIWFNADSLASSTYPEQIVDFKQSYPFRLEVRNNVLWLVGGNQRSDPFSISATISANTWHNAVVIWNGNVGTLYLDGNFIGTKPYYSLSGTTVDYQYGDYSSWDTVYDLTGAIDEVKQYNRILTFEEIQALYQDNS